MAYVKQDNYTTFENGLIDSLMSAIENANAPWMKPWNPSLDAPQNGTSGRHYNRQNMLLLEATAAAKGYKDPRWFTFEQIKKMGGHVKKGEKSVMIKGGYFKEKEQDENGQDIKSIKNEEKIYVTKYFRLFNAEQAEGIEPYVKKEIEPSAEFKICEAAEKALKESGANIENRATNKAFYAQGIDKIILPEKSQFTSEAGYYATALHELAHWTGHESRLNRDLSGEFGSKTYAKEELKAEIASYFLCRELGLEFDPGNHAGYIKNWQEIVKEDKNILKESIKEAIQINNYLKEKCPALARAITEKSQSADKEKNQNLAKAPSVDFEKLQNSKELKFGSYDQKQVEINLGSFEKYNRPKPQKQQSVMER